MENVKDTNFGYYGSCFASSTSINHCSPPQYVSDVVWTGRNRLAGGTLYQEKDREIGKEYLWKRN